MSTHEDLKNLIENLPFFLQTYLNQHPYKNTLFEIILDLGRRPEARFFDGPEYLSKKVVSWQDLDYITKRLSKFSNENRAGIKCTLHRISCIRNRQFLINGLTCRIGRAAFGMISIVRDLLESNKSVLILGKPGSGKTTIIREIARVLADEMKKRVLIIDTSTEIAGDSDIPHFGIGKARCMQVTETELQHQVMIEAVENHMPQVIVIDEIGTELEVLSARIIAEKGVQLIGTTHGNCLENLIKNPSLANLIGGIQYVTLSDDEAKRRGTQKSILERRASPAFDTIIEINQKNSWTIYENVKNSIDLVLRNHYNINQLRKLSLAGKIGIKSKKFKISSHLQLRVGFNLTDSFLFITKNWTFTNALINKKNLNLKLKKNSLIIYPYSISSNLLKEILLRMQFKFVLTNEIQKASLIIGSRKHLKQNFELLNFAKQKQIPIYSLNQISFYQVNQLVKFLCLF